MFGYGPLSLILIAMYGISAYIFGYDRMNAIKNEGFVKSTSLWLYGAALVIWYFGLVYQRKLNRAPTDNSSNRADRMAKELEKES